MLQHLDSKTIFGLLLLLACIMLLAFTAHLTAEAVDALKWIGGTFMGVRTVANAVENLITKKD